MNPASITAGTKPHDGASIGYIDRLVRDYTCITSRLRQNLVGPSIPGAGEKCSDRRFWSRYQSDSRLQRGAA